MTLMSVNLWSVLVAGIATMVLGFLWYSPLLFARPWMMAMGYDPEDKPRMQEMQKSAGKSLCHLFRRQPGIGVRSGENHPHHNREHRRSTG